MTLSSLSIVLCLLLTIVNAAFETQKYLPGKKIRLFPNIGATTYSKIDGATVSIEFGYQQGMDFLSVFNSTSISTKFDPATGVLFMWGIDSTQSYVDMISSVTFSTRAVDGKARQIAWAFGQNVMYYDPTGHFYQFLSRSGQNWEDGKKTCESDEMKYFGMRGYLATVTNVDEYNFVANRFIVDAWVGGTDKDSRGNWRWTVGPEGLEDGGKGRLFWIGGTSFENGTAPDNGPSMWARFQPDNELGTQMYLSLRHASPFGVGFHDDSSAAIQDGFICEYGGLDNAQIELNKDNLKGSVQLVPGCDMLTDQASCTNQGTSLGCQFVDSKCRLTSCLQYTSEAKCNSAWNCYYNATANPPICENTECSKYRSKESCIGDLSCKVLDPLSTTVQCISSLCGDRSGSACDCAKTLNGMCSFQIGTSTCVFNNYLDCPNLDVVFLVDGSPSMSNPFGRFSSGIDAIMDLVGTYGILAPFAAKDTDPGMRFGLVQFGTNSPRIMDGKVTLTNNQQDWANLVTWHQTAFSQQPYTYPPNVKPNITAGLTAAVDGLTSSSRTATKIIYIITQSPFFDVYSAQQYLGTKSAIKVAGAVVRNQEVKGTPGTLDANALASLSMLATNGAAVNVVMANLEKNILDICGDTMFSRALGTVAPSKKCSVNADRISCESNLQCAWDSSATTNPCVSTHCTSLCEKDCSNDKACLVGTAATSKYCARPNNCGGRDQAGCASAGICAWYQDTKKTGCVDKCRSNPTEDACQADTNKCAYNPKAITPCLAVPCVANNEKDCVNYIGAKCAWSGSACYLDMCGNFTSNTTLCDLQPQCEYDGTRKACISNICGKIVGEKQCTNLDACMWNIELSPPVCSKRQCSFYNSKDFLAKGLCDKDASCVWVSAAITKTKDMCMPITCQTRTSAKDCSALGNCVWRDQQCRENKFVQCPALDVVFMLESSQEMTKTFGRHTSGLAALIQGIREWARQAPLAAASNETGFRVATVLFGVQEGVKLAASGQRGGKGKLTGNLNEILDELMFDEDSDLIGSKELKKGTSVYIQPALQYATSLFEQSGGSGRTRVIMLLGHSNIADGDKVANDITNSVKNANIQVFSTHIRRFESVTSADRIAASMYQPLASDDIAVHFTAGTVDNFDDLVLQKFCDPTTEVGTALQISKSGDTPCSWLRTVDDCSTQNYCDWDPKATPTCPDPTIQCPNFGCIELPKSLRDQGYTCNMCTMTNGAFDCSKTQTQSVSGTGACIVSTCQKTAQAACGTTPGCLWSDAKASCVKNTCQYTTVDTCRRDYGCVFNVNSGRCEPNTCGQYRDATSCTTDTIARGDIRLPRCDWQIPKSCQNGAKCDAVCKYQECYFVPHHENDNNQDPTLLANCASYGQCDLDYGLGCVGKACSYVETPECDTTCTIDKCNSDSQCFWDPRVTDKTPVPYCRRRTTRCEYIKGEPSQCSASCGQRKATIITRILSLPLDGYVDACPAIEITEPCSDDLDEGRRSCDKWCSDLKTNLTSCSNDPSCYVNGNDCKARQRGSCSQLSVEDCPLSTTFTCAKLESACVDQISACQFDDDVSCGSMQNGFCSWLTGFSSNVKGPTVLYHPGNSPAYVLRGVGLMDVGKVPADGSVVYIEDNFQVGKDLLLPGEVPKGIQAVWNPAIGSLKFIRSSSTPVTAADFALAMGNVRFFTSSTSRKTRKVSWSFGQDTYYLSATDHHYRYYPSPGSWSTAKSLCKSNNRKLFGYVGYLASITSVQENNLLTRLQAEGWLSGTDNTEEGTWKWTAGPDEGKDFWRGASALKGGAPATATTYTNWEPPTNLNPVGEPSDTQSSNTLGGEDYLYFLRSGFWADRDSITFIDARGHTCEYKGSGSDQAPSFDVGGSSSIIISGCLPPDCVWHDNEARCTGDVECSWTPGVGCRKSCATYSAQSECLNRTGECRWDTESIPAVCTSDQCRLLGFSKCNLDNRCRYDDNSGTCVYRVGCEKLIDSKTCLANVNCLWDQMAAPIYCRNKPCNTYSNPTNCTSQPMCIWKDTGNGKGLCAQRMCEQTDPTLCNTDRLCNYLNTTIPGAVALPPGGSAVQPFLEVLSVDSSEYVDGVTVTISEGYEVDDDVLLCDIADCPPGVLVVTFDAPSLYIKVVGANITASKMAQQYLQKVKFRTRSNSPRRRVISYTMGYRMAFVGYFFKYYDVPMTSYTSAAAFCQNKAKFFGLTASLAKIQSDDDSMALRHINAKGMISAKDDGSASCDWSWDGQTSSFWSGCGNAGVLKSYAQWDLGYPRYTGAQQVLYVQTDGKWRSVAPSRAEGGVICQFGDANSKPTTNVGGARTIQPQGCFPRVCPQYGSASECKKNTLCDWRGDMCVSDERCGMFTSASSCNKVMNCFWDYDEGECTPGPRTMCNDLDINDCADPFFKDSCEWSTTVTGCVPKGCSQFPFKSVCSNNAMCRWLQKEALCVPRLCGYQSEDQCWADKQCMYDHLAPIKTCKLNPCTGLSQGTCSGQCEWSNGKGTGGSAPSAPSAATPPAASPNAPPATIMVNGSSAPAPPPPAPIATQAPSTPAPTTATSGGDKSCNPVRCASNSSSNCNLDPICVWKDKACVRTKCSDMYVTESSCDLDYQCFFDWVAKGCAADQCVQFTDLVTCNADENCLWDTVCRHKTFIEFSAPEDANANCNFEQEEPSYMAYVIPILLGLIGIGLLGVIWRLYMAYKHGYSFSDPSRYNKKFQAQELYSKELADMANDDVRGENDYEGPRMEDL